MFIIIFSGERSLADAGFILNHYQTHNTLGNGIIIVEPSKVLDEEDAQQDFMLCEMAFSMNWRQDNERLCVVCKQRIEETGEGQDTCGHLTFVSPIPENRAFPGLPRTQDIGGANA